MKYEDESEPQIEANFILEVIGRPKNHLKETLKEMIKAIRQEKNVEIVGEKIHEPVEAKEQKEFYTTFAEIEIKVRDVFTLMILIFKYMPGHVEIISPEKTTMENAGWTDIFNELTRRLHAYDELVMVLQNEKMILERKLKDVLEKK